MILIIIITIITTTGAGTDGHADRVRGGERTRLLPSRCTRRRSSRERADGSKRRDAAAELRAAEHGTSAPPPLGTVFRISIL